MITSLDELKYEGGYPTAETVEKLYDQLDLQRAAQAYLEFIPAMSMQAFLDIHTRDLGISETGGVAVYSEPGEGKSDAVGLTYNTESVYATSGLDLKKMGPAVIEVPPAVLGIIDDGRFHFVADLGNAGLDKGQGGKYLLLPPGYEGDVPDGYFVFRTPTYRNWLMVRGLEKNTGRGDEALAYYADHLKIYASLMKELRAATFLQEIIHHEDLDRQAYRDGRFHLIQAEEEMRKLSVSSKLNAEWVFLQHLHDLGWQTAEQWLEDHFDDLGVRSTWDTDFILEESLQPAHLPEGIERRKVK